MTAAAPRPDRPGPSERLYRQGPWLIGHDGRARAEAAADEVLRACEADDVGAEIVRLGTALAETDVAQFPGLIVITNPEPGSMSLRVELAESIDVASAYRSRRPRGLADLQAGRVSWWRVGVTQVVTSPELRKRYEGAELLDLACQLHDLDAWTPEDLFEAYTPSTDVTSITGSAGVLLAGGLGRPQAEALWARVRPWGVGLDQVVPVLEAFERVRRLFRSPRKVALSRPIADSPLSRLDYVLEQPGFEPQGHHPTWSDDGGRVVREAVAELRKEFPNLARPGKAKNATEQFREFYRNLDRLAIYLTITPTDQWPTDS